VTLDAFLGRLDGPQPQGDQHVARCPARDHPDRRPSLVIAERDGRILVHCRSRRCRPEDILGPLGLTLADLFVDSHPRSRVISRKPESALNAARREILTAARRQPWARAGVRELYQLADGLRLADAAPASEAATLRTAAMATFEAQMGAAIAAEFEAALYQLSLALGGVAA